MEIGSFIELQFPKGREWHTAKRHRGMEVARLNSGRAAIYHAAVCLGCNTVYLPHYQCETVREFLAKKGIRVKYYFIDETFAPLLEGPVGQNEAVVIVNYYGIFSSARMAALASRYSNVILDCSQAFFCQPVATCMNVYSARKFVGVPDGAYVVGKGAGRMTETYSKCFSSDTAAFLLLRHEYGCEGKTYAARTENEERIDGEDVMQMSDLTFRILDGTDYREIIQKRKSNFAFAHSLFQTRNQLPVLSFYDENTVPMVYPLLIENEKILPALLQNKHFQGNWWRYILNEVESNRFEHRLSEFMVPITIDQRYGKEELQFIHQTVESVL